MPVAIPSDWPASLLPPNATVLERALEVLLAERLAAIESAYRAWWSADDCPEQDLPWLAWALSIDEWDPAWPLAVRRALVARAIDTQRRKGTVASISSIFTVFGGSVALQEWWQSDPPAAPHTFNLLVALAGTDAPTTEYVDSVMRAVDAAKPLRSHYTFTLAQRFNGAIGLRGVARTAVFARLSATAPAQIST